MDWRQLRSGALLGAVVSAVILTGCADNPPTEGRLTVAAAASLTRAFDVIGHEFTAETGVEVAMSYAATTVLSQQIANGAPFDVFAAADIEHVDRLAGQGWIRPDSRAVYGRGRLVVVLRGPAGNAGGQRDQAEWPPELAKLLLSPEIRYVATANPNLAPYGAASVEALHTAGIWEQVEPKLVYANNVNQALQLVDSGNADAGFSAASLLGEGDARVTFPVDPKLYTPLDQAIGITRQSEQPELAQRFVDFVLGDEGQKLLRRSGFDPPSARQQR